jgi:hypothetical protein
LSYDKLHNICSKRQDLSQENVQFAGVLDTGYDLDYTYDPTNGHQVSSIADTSYRGVTDDAPRRARSMHYAYDDNGNLVYNTIHASPKKFGTDLNYSVSPICSQIGQNKDFAFFFIRSFNIERFCDFLYTFSEHGKILRFSLHVIRLNLSNQQPPFPSGMR